VCPFLIDPESIQRVEKLRHKENLVGKKLYVGNLAYTVTQTNLEEWFAQYGTVQSAQVVTDRDMGRSKGFGFVEMDTDAQAQAAIQGLNEHEYQGRRLTVSEAKPRVARTSGFAGSRLDGSARTGGGGGYGGSGRRPS
jgi:RNA recognition motif-containing protein